MLQFTTPTGRFHITSHGNGWAYEVTHQATGDSLWFQDHDADHFYGETAKLEDEDAIQTYFDYLYE